MLLHTNNMKNFLVVMYDPVKYFYEAVVLVVFGEKRKNFPFRSSGCERRYFSNARTGHTSGFFGFEYTCHVSPDLSTDWVTFRFGKIKHQAIIIPLNMIHVHDEAFITLCEEVPL